ncbi:MAG TPA: CusA/CzcA family heavy metal efflux RND transporter, partial [Aequorivita sp.]|nr:CusA/CzcA family heavy metal efflux RND transporter [Aequorivita sp.]
ELADITYQKGAAKISRDDTRRRIVVGINVRNRDLQSVVDDVQQLINDNIKLPVGYTITYGGQFENLESAKARLLVAVPVALILIFILLYFAFKSVKEALMIYSAIPLSAVGGVLLLWIRDLPFSISAGVGFIALFGIAVLNGIVLIEHFKVLKKEGKFSDINELIKQGTKDRLRAVLLTAMAAALGFLPMAISSNAGAEVQRPLATVVIGGLITATILTLVVLPVLYAYFNSPKKDRKSSTGKGVVGITVVLLLVSLNLKAQQNPMTLEELIPLAIENNAGLSANNLSVEKLAALVNSAFSFDKTHIYYEFDENNLTLNNEPLRVFGIQQDFRFPTVYFSEKKVNQANVAVATSTYAIQKKALERKVTSAYYNYQIASEKQRVLRILDSLYSSFASMAARRFELGETNYLEKITAASEQKQINLNYLESQRNVVVAYGSLVRIIQLKDTLVVVKDDVLKIPLKTIDISSSAELMYYQNRVSLIQQQRRFENQQLLPDLSFNYFQGTNSGLSNSLYGYQVGVKIPLLFGGQSSRIKAAGIAEEVAIEESNEYNIQLNAKFNALIVQMNQLSTALAYYEEEGAALSDEILKTANGSFKNGEIDFYQYIQSLESAYEVKLEYLDKLNEYNNIVIDINYLTL